MPAPLLLAGLAGLALMGNPLKRIFKAKAKRCMLLLSAGIGAADRRNV